MVSRYAEVFWAYALYLKTLVVYVAYLSHYEASDHLNCLNLVG